MMIEYFISSPLIDMVTKVLLSLPLNDPMVEDPISSLMIDLMTKVLYSWVVKYLMIEDPISSPVIEEPISMLEKMIPPLEVDEYLDGR